MFTRTLLALFAIFGACTAVKVVDPPGPETKVYVSVTTNKIGSIKEVEGQFSFDVYFYFAWRDTNPNITDDGPFNEENQFFPFPEFMNKAEGGNTDLDSPKDKCSCTTTDGPPPYVDGLTALEASGTWCSCQSRPQVTLDAELLLKAFPFDLQSANIIIESSKHEASGVIWVPVASSAKGLLPPSGNEGVSGWNITSTKAETYMHDYTLFGETYHALKFSLRLARIPDYYIPRYVWGVVFLVAMALLTLFVPGSEPDREFVARPPSDGPTCIIILLTQPTPMTGLGFVQSSFLGIVSWQFILVSSTPVTGCKFAARPAAPTRKHSTNPPKPATQQITPSSTAS